MPVTDTLEKLFGQDKDTTPESAALEFITAGDNYESKTILPFQKYALGISFLKRLADIIDEEMDEVTQIYNMERVEQLKLTRSGFVQTKKNYTYKKLSDNITPIIKNTATLMPNIDGKSRQQFENVLKWLREENSRKLKPDSVTAVRNLMTQ